MKSIIFTAICVIILGAAWTAYLHWGNKRFVESLPEPPPRSNIDPVTDTQRREIENNDPPAEPTPELPAVREESPPAPRPPHRGDPQVSGHVPIPRVMAGAPETSEEQKAQDPASAMTASVEEIIENTRQHLIEQHGDIPEIDIYLRHMRPVFQAAKDGETEIIVVSTPKEHLEMSRVMSILYPSEEHTQHYKDVLEDVQRREALERLRAADTGR